MDDIDLTHMMDEMTTIINAMNHGNQLGYQETYFKAISLRDQMTTIRNKMERARGS